MQPRLRLLRPGLPLQAGPRELHRKAQRDVLDQEGHRRCQRQGRRRQIDGHLDAGDPAAAEGLRRSRPGRRYHRPVYPEGVRPA